jgi:hypothetical protein
MIIRFINALLLQLTADVTIYTPDMKLLYNTFAAVVLLLLVDAVASEDQVRNRLD